MGHDWIIDVLADLKSFASTNDLPQLAEHLEETALTARQEIDSKVEKPSRTMRGDGAGDRYFFASAGTGRRA